MYHLKVSSESTRLEELASLYLFLFCGVVIEKNNQPLLDNKVEELKIKYASELLRADESVWHLSSSDNPFPNNA